jgi:hypothetical protein
LTNIIVFTYTHFVQDEGLESPSPSYNPPQSTTPQSSSYEYGQPPPRKRNPKKLLLLIGAVLILLVGFNALRTLGSKNEPSPTPSPTPSIEDFSSLETPSPSLEPTPTPEPEVNPVDAATGLDRSDLSIRIENGSGTAGVASKASAYLKGLGYNVISTGNASNFNYEDVTIQVKSSEKQFLPLLNKDLSREYSVGAATSDLSATASAEALVIIGK